MKADYAGYAGGCLSFKKKKIVAGQFAAVKYRSETYCWTQKLKIQETVWVVLAVVNEFTLLKNNKHCLFRKTINTAFSRLRFEISRLRLRSRFLPG